ncbi:hypothetical protein [Alsobacter sp. R-9]
MSACQRPVLALSAALLLSSAALILPAGSAQAQPMAFWGWGPPGPAVEERLPPGTYRSYSSRQIAEILYRRHGAAQVLMVRPAGDVFDAEVIDRRGYRVRYVIAPDTAEILERVVLGERRWERDPAVPPGLVPQPGPGRDRAPAPREARREPAERTAPVAPPVQEGPSVTVPRVGPVEQRPLPEPPVAAKPKGPEAEPAPPRAPAATPSPAPGAPAASPDRAEPQAAPQRTPQPKPELARPPALQPETPRTVTPAPTGAPPAAGAAPQRPATAQTRPVQAPPRIPEPLVDPKTGQKNPLATVPVAPLDETVKPSGPVTIVPPAPLE